MKIDRIFIIEKEEQETIKKFKKLLTYICYDVDMDCENCVFEHYCALDNDPIESFIKSFSPYVDGIKIEK